MLEKIKSFFESHIALTEQDGYPEDNLRVASAALLMEMLHTEESFGQEKQRLVMELLEKTFTLSKEQALNLMEIADQKRVHATDYFEFTHLITNAFSRSQKIQLIESLWIISFADHHLDIDEEYLVDKIARLICIPHDEVLTAKNRARTS